MSVILFLFCFSFFSPWIANLLRIFEAFQRSELFHYGDIKCWCFVTYLCLIHKQKVPFSVWMRCNRLVWDDHSKCTMQRCLQSNKLRRVVDPLLVREPEIASLVKLKPKLVVFVPKLNQICADIIEIYLLIFLLCIYIYIHSPTILLGTPC